MIRSRTFQAGNAEVAMNFYVELFENSRTENGKITMPLSNYGFSSCFGLVIDQFGVSWQFNLA